LAAVHKKLRKQRKSREDGGASQQQNRETAEWQAREAAQTGDAYSKLIAEGVWYASKEDRRKAAKAYREAIALRPDEPVAYYNLGNALSNSGHHVEAAQRYLEAKDRFPVGSEEWAGATAQAFNMLKLEECDEAAKPEWWNDEGLKALSARVVRAAPNEATAHSMRADVLGGHCSDLWEVGHCSDLWEVGPRSAAELEEAATHFDRAAAMCDAPAAKAWHASFAVAYRSRAEAM